MAGVRLTEERRSYWRAQLQERHSSWHYLTEREREARAAEKARREEAGEAIEEALGALNEAGEVLKTGYEPAEQLSLLSSTAPRELVVLPPVEEPAPAGTVPATHAAFLEAAMREAPMREAPGHRPTPPTAPAKKRGRPSRADLAEREERVLAHYARWPEAHPPSLAELADDADVTEAHALAIAEARGLAIWAPPCATTDAEHAVLASHKKLASYGDAPELEELARHADTNVERTMEIVRAFRLDVEGVARAMAPDLTAEPAGAA